MKKAKKLSPKIKTFSSRLETWSVNRKTVLLFVVIFAGVGSALLIISHAATPTANIEPENSTVTSPAITSTDSNASGGGYVQFKAASGAATSCQTGWPSRSGVFWPCPENTGVPVGVTLKTIANSGTGACTNTASTTDTAHCPAGLKYNSSRGYFVDSCSASGGSQVVIDGWSTSSGIGIYASNGQHPVGQSEAATKAASCVVVTRSKFDVPKCTSNGGCQGTVVDTSYASSTQCSPGPCGPVFVSDVEAIGHGTNTGFTVPFSETNYHIWRILSHGWSGDEQCDGYCDVVDSYNYGQITDDTGGNHLNAFITNGNGGRPIRIEHNTLWCQEQATPPPQNNGWGCSSELSLFADFATVDQVTVKNNWFKPVPTGHYCSYTGTVSGKAYGAATNVVYTGNVFEKGATGPCFHRDGPTQGPAAAVDAWANTAGSCWSTTNTWSDGTTTGLPAGSSGC